MIKIYTIKKNNNNKLLVQDKTELIYIFTQNLNTRKHINKQKNKHIQEL